MEGKINGTLCCTRLFACSLSINGNLEGWALCRSINFQICFVNQCFYFYFITFDGVLKNAFKMDFNTRQNFKSLSSMSTTIFSRYHYKSVKFNFKNLLFIVSKSQFAWQNPPILACIPVCALIYDEI